MNLILRRAAQQAEKIEGKETRGLLMIEIDGLSYFILKEPIEAGLMPTIKNLMDNADYQISRIDCGLPATTPGWYFTGQ